MRQGIAVLVMLGLASTAFAAPAMTPGKVTEVTVYRGQAQVVREVKLEGKAGPVELVVTDLPQYVVGDSLFAESTGAVDVRAVRHRTRAVGSEPREEVRLLDEQIRKVGDDLELAERLAEVAKRQQAYLDKLENFVAPTATAEMTRGVLNAAEVEKLANFSMDKRRQAVQQAHELAIKTRELKEKAELLQRQRSELTKGSTKTMQEAVLFLEKQDDKPQTVRVTYLVNRCGWSPAYNFRASAKANTVAVEYNAVVQQMSGEDWSNVMLTLSTASPALSAATPGLAPLKVSLQHNGQPLPQGKSKAALAQQLRQYQKGQMDYINRQQTAISNSSNNVINWRMNDFAGNVQIIEFNGDVTVLRDNNTTTPDAGPSLSYRLGSKVSLASRSDQQMIRIVRADLAGALYYVAMPVLSNFVYREAELTNTTGSDLLGGPVSVYLDGRFVGRTEIGTVARGQGFVLGFGADPQLQCSRELVKREDKTQGANKVQHFSYRLAVGNYKDTPVPVRVFDRIPKTEHETDLRVTLGEMSDKLSADAVYVRREQSLGILRWDVQVPAKAAGQTERAVTYNYTLEFDRNTILANPTGEAAAAQEADFMELQEQRFFNQ